MQIAREDAKQVLAGVSRGRKRARLRGWAVGLVVCVMPFGCLRLVRLRRVPQYLYDSAHPGMNAALETVCSYRELRTPGGWPLLRSARWDKNYRAEVQALGRRNRVAGDAIEIRDKPAAECRHIGEGVNLATAVLDKSLPSGVDLYGLWLISPGVCILSFFKFLNELIKRRVPVADAGAIAQYRIEASRVTIVVHRYLLITLYGPYAGAQTEQRDAGECRPYHGSEIQSWVHGITSLLFKAGSLGETEGIAFWASGPVRLRCKRIYLRSRDVNEIVAARRS